MSCAIAGLATALPKFSLTQEQAASVAQVLCLSAEQAPLVPVLYRQTEITRRHMVLNQNIVVDMLNGTRASESIFLPSGESDDHGPTTRQRMQSYVEEAGPLAVRAAQAALEESGLNQREFTHLITVSCTGFSAPGVDYELIQSLDLPSTIQRTHIGFMGCHGALNGLRVARAFTDADPAARVLLCAVELCSLHYHYGWDPKRVVANALFGDGAAAVVGVPSDQANADAWQVAGTGSCLFPNSAYAMTWNIGDYGFDMTLSTRVPNLIEANLRPWLDNWLLQNGIAFEDVASWAIHPGGPRVLNAVNQVLGLDKDATAVSREVLTEHGNMSSPTVLFILERLRRLAAPRPCVAMGFGPGLVVEATLFR
jgi:predicted naringenin-chalcone synthase